jgi:hypothetical protein
VWDELAASTEADPAEKSGGGGAGSSISGEAARVASARPPAEAAWVRKRLEEGLAAGDNSLNRSKRRADAGAAVGGRERLRKLVRKREPQCSRAEDRVEAIIGFAGRRRNEVVQDGQRPVGPGGGGRSRRRR